jgi:hypothetical protein
MIHIDIMKHLGHIKIQDNKIVFVYPKLPKPDWSLTLKMVLRNGGEEDDARMGYNVEIKAYNASKRKVEVSNVKRIKWLYFFYFGDKVIMHPNYELKHNQPCEAEVNGKATIVKIL